MTPSAYILRAAKFGTPQLCPNYGYLVHYQLPKSLMNISSNSNFREKSKEKPVAVRPQAYAH